MWPSAQWPAAWFQVDDQLRRTDVLLGEPFAPGAALAAALARGAQQTLEEVQQSRGCADAAALALPPDSNGRCAVMPRAADDYVVCNADQGEPGTFKDRVLRRAVPMPIRRDDGGSLGGRRAARPALPAR